MVANLNKVIQDKDLQLQQGNMSAELEQLRHEVQEKSQALTKLQETVSQGDVAFKSFEQVCFYLLYSIIFVLL